MNMYTSQSCQHTAMIRAWNNLHGSQHLRPKSQPVVAVDVCQNECKPLPELEMRQERKRNAKDLPIPRPISRRSAGEPPGIGAVEDHKRGETGLFWSRYEPSSPSQCGVAPPVEPNRTSSPL